MPVREIVQDKAALSIISCSETIPEEAMSVIQDLMDTAHKHRDNCAGLAANQIGSGLRVFVIKVRGKFMAFINPLFNPIQPKVKCVEGCLSFPGRVADTSRHPVIFTSPPRGKQRGLKLDGIAAIAFQHELDHLNGVTI